MIEWLPLQPGPTIILSFSFFYILSMIETAGRDAARAYQNYESVNWNELISVSIVDTACGRRNASH
jgi:hypothetical protein